MTRKDYVLLADTIKNARKVVIVGEGTTLVSVEHLANTLATELEIDNPRFNRHRFLVACGVYDSIIADVLATTGKEAK
jgi:phosphoheptose isomerase